MTIASQRTSMMRKSMTIALQRVSMWHKKINDHCIAEGLNVNIRKLMTIASQRVLMYKRRTWILLLKFRQTSRECLTLVRLTWIFFNFLSSKMKEFNNHSYEWIGLWLERWKLFYSKRWMTHVYMTWYDVWITLCMNFSFAFFLKTNLNCSPFHYYF